MRPKVLSILVLVVPATLFAAGEVDRAKKLYTQMNYREAIQALAPVASSGDPVVHELVGKSWFALAEYKKAQESFEKAVAANPGSSAYHHWLGKAYGRRAGARRTVRASPVR